ncbi:protein D2-like [Bicyclus anynana]|uniref:Protein D2-like n=1 Tax=Bicyclus anynana TaxID=110368 RepID=A0A6J1NL03_BICAN|nr:protein D2-like [Bicyclus anynana]
MRVLLVCVAVALLSCPAELQRRRRTVAEAFNDFQICRDLNISAPETMLEVYYGNEEIKTGEEIYADITVEFPEVGFAVEPGCYYTFIIVDPDSPSAYDPFWRSYLMALYVNIGSSPSSLGGLDLHTGFEVATHIPTSPIPGTGIHRYVLLLFKQPYGISTIDENLLCFQQFRLNFRVDEFMCYYNLTGPVAGNFYLSQFPERT